MYGLIVGIETVEGGRDTLIAILHEGFQDIEGCIYHTLAKDNFDENLIWVNEAWESKAHHRVALQLPSVQTAITQGRPLIVGMPTRVETTPVA